jgi:hypothetical protein
LRYYKIQQKPQNSNKLAILRFYFVCKILEIK